MSSSFTNRASLGVENLEGREMMSWGSVAPAVLPSGGDRFTFPTGSASGRYSTTSDITRGENDVYAFTAARTGNFTFDAKKAPGSGIDTVIALYNSSNRLVASNDDGGGGTDSRMTVNLTAGQRYSVVVSNYTGTRNGRYTLTFSEPTLTVHASQALGRVYARGDASLAGRTLTLNLYGQTRTSFTYADHFVRVRILDASGRAIHTGSYERGFRTAGSFIPGSPETKSQSWTVDVGNLDLTRAARLSIEVGQR